MTACAWPVSEDCLPDLPAAADPGYAAALALRENAQAMAVHVLWALSGRQFGVCDYIVRPCAPLPDWCKPGAGRVTSYVLSWEGDHWINLWCGCTGYCRASGPGAVHLPGPAQSVVEVVVNGAVLAADQYVLEGDVLHRVGGVAWPRQDLSRPMGEVNTWSVEYLRGHPVPAGVDQLTGLLAREFIAACSDGKCRLPRSVTNVSRQGVSYQIYNPNQIYQDGKTGLPEVDLWLAAVNPQRLLAAPSVL